MNHFALRQAVGETTREALGELLSSDGGAECSAVARYWTPEDGELLSIFVSEGSAGPAFEGTDGVVLPVLPITAEEYGPPLMESTATGEDLGLVMVRRTLDPLTHSEFRAIALQAIMCAHEYSDMRWLRSYWSRGTDQLFCLFETRTHDLVREHAERSRIPCDEVLDAVEILA